MPEPVTPIGILQQSIYHVRSNRYAYAALGIAAAAYSAVRLLGPGGAVVAIAVGLVAMTGIRLFEAYSQGGVKLLHLPAQVLLWTTTLACASFIFALLSAVVFGKPEGLLERLQLAKAQSIASATAASTTPASTAAAPSSVPTAPSDAPKVGTATSAAVPPDATAPTATPLAPSGHSPGTGAVVHPTVSVSGTDYMAAGVSEALTSGAARLGSNCSAITVAIQGSDIARTSAVSCTCRNSKQVLSGADSTVRNVQRANVPTILQQVAAVSGKCH